MGTHRLKPHPAEPPRGISAVDVRWTEFVDGRLMLRWFVNGQDALKVPAFSGKSRGDDLWHTTCFELFIRDRAGAGYTELNFSPSQRWAAYRFTGYRDGRSDLDLAEPPLIAAAAGDQIYVLTVTLDESVLDGGAVAGLNAVIEEKCGRKSYWALAHGAGEQPDFHDPACFALPLGAAQRA